MFSYARNSYYRNHDRYTLCAYHWHEGHEGRWQDCEACRDDIETEMYVYPTFRTLKTNKITILNGAAKESNYLQSDRC